MKYSEFYIRLVPLTPWNEILIAQLSENGFDTFIEHEDGFSAFIPTENFNQEILDDVLNVLPQEVNYSIEKQELEDINWNQEWEKNFEPILVENQIYLHADFHEKRSEIPYQINIQPKMSFGTGHHETTYLMLKTMLPMDFEDKFVLDMGCGTSVLAVFAKQKGAKYVLAIDNDTWAFENSLENTKRNQVEIDVKLGDASLLGTQKFDVILANINKNILLQDMEKYVQNLNPNGFLLMSGIYNFDVEDITEIAEELGLTFLSSEEKNNWCAVKFHKIN